MITKVYGAVDGKDVILEHVGGDTWQVVVPFDRDGVYIVEFYAENDHGQMAFYATALMIITAAGTCTTLKMFPFRARLLPPAYQVTLLPGYSARLKRCDLCGRY